MANIFLASSLQTVAKSVGEHIKKPANFLFVTTASEVEEGDKTWLELDRQSMTDAGFEIENYTLTGKTKSEIEKKLAEVDGVAMAGGNTFFLLQQLQQTDSLDLFRQFVNDGKIYIGSSAGSIVAGPDIAPGRDLDDLSKAPLLEGTKGISLTDVLVFPHWGSEHFYNQYKKSFDVCFDDKHKIVLLNDYQYLMVDGSNLQLIDIR